MFTSIHRSHVQYHMSHVTYQMAYIPCHMSHVIFFVFQSGEAGWWRVCYQRGLSCPFLMKTYITALCTFINNFKSSAQCLLCCSVLYGMCLTGVQWVILLIRENSIFRISLNFWFQQRVVMNFCVHQYFSKFKRCC